MFMYVFYDGNQNIYSKKDKIVPILNNVEPFELTMNCRNTPSIHKLAMRYYKGSVLPSNLMKIDRPPEYIRIEYNLDDTLSKVIGRLNSEEKIPLDKIVVLTPRKGEKKGPSYPDVKTRFKSPSVNVGQYTITRERRLLDIKNSIFCSTIQSYKGLESDVVILTELDSVIQAKHIHELMYVGLSRSRAHLVILYEETDTIKRLTNQSV